MSADTPGREPGGLPVDESATDRVTVRLPADVFADVDALVDAGDFPSQSAALREGLYTMLHARRERIDKLRGHTTDASEEER